MSFFQSLTDRLLGWSQIVPVEIFTFLGTLVEEIIAPIPSPVIMAAAGSIAASQSRSLGFLLWLAVIGAFGKGLGAIVVYVISDKGEDFVLTKFGRFIGVSHQDVERFGQYFGTGNKDFILIFLARLIPVVPTSAISLVAGILKLNFKNYIIASFFGYIGRNLIYLYIGYVGLQSYKGFVEGLESVESLLQLVIAGLLVLVVGWLYFKRRKSGADSLLDKIYGKVRK